MRSNPAKIIEAWFTDYAQDGDFVYEPQPAPYTVIASSKTKGRIIYATKPHYAASAIYESDDCAQLGLVGRYGLPGRFDLAWIRKVVANHELFFLGDLDPPDLMIFAWLRARLRPQRIEHLGINDAYLAATQVQLPDEWIFRCSPSERKSLPVLFKAFPDLRRILGFKCARVLEDGRKLEIDAVRSALGAVELLLRPVIASKK